MRKTIASTLPCLILNAIVATVLLLMAVLTAADVIGRYVFNRPVSGTDELIAAGMAILIFGSLPLVAWRREQITVDIFTTLFRGRAQLLVVNVIGGVVLGYLALKLFTLASKMMRNGDHSSLLYLPHAPLAYAMAALTAIAAVITFVLAFAPLPSRSQELDVE